MKTKSLMSPKMGFMISIFLISVLMTAAMTLGMNLIHNPDDPQFAQHAWDDFLVGLTIAIPVGYTVVPLVQWLIGKLMGR